MENYATRGPELNGGHEEQQTDAAHNAGSTPHGRHLEESGTSGQNVTEASNETTRVFTMLENNPEVMNALAYRLGVSKKLAFYDVYSIYDPDMMAMIPRPVLGLLVTIPMTDAWDEDRKAEDGACDWYQDAGPDEKVFWIRQTIIHGCGLIGLLHCACNGLATRYITPGSQLARFLEAATPLHMNDRAELLWNDDKMYEASEAYAVGGDTEAIRYGPEEGPGNHFVALVKGSDGHLWELEGGRKGPLDRGLLREEEDAFSEHALELGLKRLIELQRESGGQLRFSCIALAASAEED